VEKIVLLCFLMAVIGVLAEWSRAPQASRPGGHPSPGPRSQALGAGGIQGQPVPE
jgi:hypothetical protein